jgi:hypothetical protein
MNKNYYCDICDKLPNAHSFRVICNTIFKDNNTISVYYTKVDEAIRYDDTEGILQHYENLLRYDSPSDWIWIFDCDGYGLKHSMEIKTAIGIAKIINKSLGLRRILVINSNFLINMMFKTVKIFLNNQLINNTVMIKKEEKTKFLLELSKYIFYQEDFKELAKLMKWI